jgi:hypothetical protein
MSNPCNKYNKEFRGAGDSYIELPSNEKKQVWRRVRDAANKNAAIRDELVQTAILGGIAPSILKNLGEDL